MSDQISYLYLFHYYFEVVEADISVWPRCFLAVCLQFCCVRSLIDIYFTSQSVLFSSSAEYCNYIAARQPGHDETKSSGTRQSGDRRQKERGCPRVTSSAEARRSRLQREGILVQVLVRAGVVGGKDDITLAEVVGTVQERVCDGYGERQ